MTEQHPTSPRGTPPAPSWGRRLAAAAASLVLLAGTAVAQDKPEPVAPKSHLENGTVTATSNIAGATANYEFTFRHGGGNGNVTDPQIRVTFPAGYDLSGASWNQAGSGIGSTPPPDPAVPPAAGTWGVATVATPDAGARWLNLATSGEFQSLSGTTTYRVAVTGVVNPPSGGNQSINIQILTPGGVMNTSGNVSFSLAGPPNPPNAPTGTAGSSQVTVNWTAPANGGSPITGYTVEVSSNGGASWSDAPGACAAATTEASTATSCVASPLNPGTGYVFRVRAINAIGPSAFSNASGTVTPFTLPDPPQNVAGTSGNTSVALSWDAPASNGGSAITGYTVQQSTDGVAWNPAAGSCTSPVAATSCTATGLTNGTPYSFRVAANNAAGASAFESTAEPVTPAVAPDAPTDVQGTAGNRSVLVSWTAPVNNGGAVITNYTVTPNPDGLSCNTAGTSCTVTGLTNGTAYTFTVTATNSAGTSGPSVASSAVTPLSSPSATNITAINTGLQAPPRARTNETFAVVYELLSDFQVVGTLPNSVRVEAQLDDGTQVASCIGDLTGVDATRSTGSCNLSGLAPSDSVARLQAFFLGSPEITPSNSAPSTFQVVRSNTSTTLTTGSPSVFGQDITLTGTFAAVAPGAGPVEGIARFVRLPSNETIVEVPIVAGSASTTIPSPGVGTWRYAVALVTNTDFNGSNQAQDHLVNRASTTTTVTSVAQPSTVNSPTAITASVTVNGPGAGTPGGTVRIDRVGGAPAEFCEFMLPATGCSITFLSKQVGATVSASYLGNDDFNGSSGTSAAFDIDGIATTLSLTPPASAPFYGDSFAVGYTLAGGDGQFNGAVTLTAEGPAPANTIYTAVCSASLPDGSAGECLFTGATLPLPVGSYAVSASYAGDPTDLAASATSAFSIQAATTALTVTTNPTSSAAGQNVTLAIELSISNGAGSLSGTVTVSAAGLDPASCTFNPAGAASPYAADCLAAFTNFGLGQTVTATFVPTDGTNYTGSSGTTSHDVTAAATTLSIGMVDPAAPQVGGNVLVPFTVSGGLGDLDGSITISLNGAAVTCGSPVFNTTGVNRGQGSCTLAASLLQAADNYTLRVDFIADVGANDASSFDEGVINVARRNTSTTLVAAPVSPSEAGTSVGFTVTVSPTGGDFFAVGNAASGTAYVCINGSACDAFTNVCPVTLTETASGAASGSCSFTFNDVATRDLVAVYVGNTNFAGSNSAVQPYQTLRASTTTAITGLSPATTLVGQQLTVSFDVNGGAGNIEGSVIVTATRTGGGSESCGPVTVAADGTGSCTFRVADGNGLELAGDWSFVAAFTADPAGNEADSDSSGNPPTTRTVTQASTTLVLSSAPRPSIYNQPFTLTATVTAVAPSEGFPTGDVEFQDADSNTVAVVTLTPTATPGVSIAEVSGLVRPVGNFAFSAFTVTNPNFVGANSFEFTHPVVQADQTITFAQPPAVDYANGGSFTVSATADSNVDGLLVSFASSTPGVCTVAAPGTSPATINILSGGNCVLTASQGGNVNWNAATPVERTVTINRIAQTITFGALPNRPAAAGSFTVSATSDSGLPVSFAAAPAGVCTIAGADVSFVGPGECTVTASQAGDASYEPAADVSRSFFYVAVAVSPETVPAGERNQAYSVQFGASGAGSVGPFSFGLVGALPAGVTLTGDTLSGTPTEAGSFTFTVTATDSSGAPNIGAPYSGSREYTLIIARNAQTITFGALPDRLLSASPFTVSATSSSGLPVSFASSTAAVCMVAGDQVTLVATGTCTVVASQAGDSNYEPADDVVRSFEVRDAVVITTDSPLANGVHDVAYGPLQFAATGGNGSYVFSLSAGALPSGMSLSASGELSGTPSGANTYNFEITATDTSPDQGPFSGSKAFVLAIERAPLALSFVAPTPASVVYSVGGSFSVATSGNNENPVSFSAGPAGVCEVDGVTNSQINLIGAGTCTVTASATESANIQAGSFDALVDVQQATPGVSLMVAPLTTSPNDPVTLTASVSGSGGPTGTVSFRRNGVDIGGCVNVALVAGEAECITTTLPQGTNLLTARYNGDGNNVAAVSNEVSQVVLTGTTITLSPGNLTEARFGQAVNVGYTVSGGVAPNEGNVTVTATRPGSTLTCTAAASAGSCTLTGLVTTGPVLADGYTVSAAYAGDADDGASSTTVSQTLNVLRSNTNTNLVITPATSSPFNQGFTLTATVTAVAPGSGIPPGTIVFLRDGESIGEIALDPSGVAVFNVAPGLAVGSYLFRAEYAQTTNYLQSFDNEQYQITAKATTTTITGASANPSALSAEVVFSYTVTTDPGTTPTGNVTLTASTGETCTATVAAGSCPITFGTAGARTLTAAYVGDSQHAASTSAAFSQTVNQGSTTATLSITPASPAQIGQQVSFDVAVTGTPGSPLPTGTVNVVHGPGTTICSFTLPAAGCQVTFSAEQNFSDVRAVYAGDTNFTGSTSNTVASYVVEKVPTSIVFVTADSTITFGDSIAIATTVSGGINGNLGLVTVTATAIDKAPVSCSAAATAGSCTLVGLEAAIWSVSASYAGDADDQASSTAAPITVTVNKAAQAITFGANPGPLTFGGASGSVSATASSGLAVSYSTASAACSVEAVSGAITIIAAGDCVVAANQAGNDNFEAAPEVTQTVVINKAAQTIEFGANPGPFTFGGAAGSVSATASSGLAVSFSTASAACSVDAVSGAITIIAAGDCVVAANQAGNDNFEAAPEVTQTVVINKAAQTITFGANPGPFTFGGTAGSVSATASSGLAVSFSTASTGICSVDAVSGAITIIGAGNCVVAANQAGNDNFDAAPEVTQTVVINKAAQTITFGANPGPLTFGGTSGSVSATASSGLAVSYSTASAACSVDAVTGAITMLGAGNCVVAANQAGNDNFDAAPEVTQTVVINPGNQAPLVVTATPNPVVALQTSTLTTTGGSGEGAVTFAVTAGEASCSVTGSTLNALAAGTCTVTATKAADANYLVQTGTVVVTVLPAPVDLSIVKTGRYTIGGIVWELLVSNAGPGPANGATVLDALPSEVASASWTCATNSGGATCATGSGTGDVDVDVNLPANSSVVITITATLTGTPASVSNTAEVIAPDGITDTNLANNTSTLNLPVALFSNGFEGDPLLVGELKSMGGTVALDGALLEGLLEGHKAINAARYWAGEQQLQLQVREVRGLVEVRLLQASGKSGLSSTRWIELWPGDVVRIDYAKSGNGLDSQLAVGPAQ